MSFVGTRPEAVKYVEKYKPEYMATLLLPAGITSEASIRYRGSFTERLLAYADMIQSAVQQDSSEVIRQLVEERKRQRLTQQELSDITGVRTSNIARFEGGTRIPTLLMLEKYANALGKHIEVSIRDKE